MRLAILIAALLVAASAAAQDRTLKIILGYPPGASSDLLARMLADKMRVSLGQSVVVENRPGANGIVGNEAVKAAAPDGTTLLLTPVATMAIFPHSYRNALRYDPFTDFEPVAHLSNFQLSFMVNADLPAKSIAQYVRLVKKDPVRGREAPTDRIQG